MKSCAVWLCLAQDLTLPCVSTLYVLSPRQSPSWWPLWLPDGLRNTAELVGGILQHLQFQVCTERLGMCSLWVGVGTTVFHTSTRVRVQNMFYLPPRVLVICNGEILYLFYRVWSYN